MSIRMIYRRRWPKPLGGVLALLVFAAAFPFYQAVRAERERIGRQPHVSLSGQGSGNHSIYQITATGEPADEVDRLMGNAVNDWVTGESKRRAESLRLIERKHPFVVTLCLRAPRLTPEVLGNLAEFPRSPHYQLRLVLEVDQITPEGFTALSSLTNLERVHFRPSIRGDLPER